MKWIGVEEELPEIGSTVLVVFSMDFKKLVTYRMYHGNFSPSWQYDMGNNGKVTHWMSLPKDPK